MHITVGRTLIVLGLAAAAATVVWMLIPGRIPVEVVSVKKDSFVASVDEDGKTRIRGRYVVAAPLVAQNDRAKNDLARTRTLVERGATTVQALERADLVMRLADRDLHAAEFQNHAAEHELNQTRAVLARYRDGADLPPESWNLTAPVAGVVLKVAQESETIIQPGAPLLEIGDSRDLEIVVDVLSTDAVDIRPGAEVAIEHWGGQGELSGRVRRVEPAAFTKVSTLGVEEQRVNVLVDLMSPAEKWAGLGDAFQVDARINVFTQEDATIVPTGALFRRAENWAVYIVKDGRAEIKDVKLLRRSGRLAAVASGLAEGESVVVYPGDRVASGVRVEVRQAGDSR